MWGHFHLTSLEKTTILVDIRGAEEPIVIRWNGGSIHMSVAEALDMYTQIEKAVHSVAQTEGECRGL